MRVRISLLPREFSALWRALCARRRRRHRDIRLGRTNVAQARAQRSSTKILHDSSLPIAAPAGSCQVALFESVRKLFKKSCTQIDPRVLTPITSIARTRCSRSLPHPKPLRAFGVLRSIACASASRLDDLVAVRRYSGSHDQGGCASHALFVRSLFAFALYIRSVERARSLARRADTRRELPLLLMRHERPHDDPRADRARGQRTLQSREPPRTAQGRCPRAPPAAQHAQRNLGIHGDRAIAWSLRRGSRSPSRDAVAILHLKSAKGLAVARSDHQARSHPETSP